MTWKVTIAAVGALVAAWLTVIGALLLAHRNTPAPAGLHTVWCVKPGYPHDLALPYVVGPGTGLSGCPSGQQQVTP